MPKVRVAKTQKDIAALGGQARAQKLTEEERKEIAREAAAARWNPDIPRAPHMGELEIGNKRIACAVLVDGRRVLTQETFLGAIGRAKKAKAGTGSTNMEAGLPPFLAAENLRPFISDELRQKCNPIVFRSPKGSKGFGYDAMLLPMVCEVYLQAREDGELLPSQEHVARMCEVLMRGLARVGIIALVDEATGYQEQRAKDELRTILEAYVSEELRPWVRRFPEEFFRQIYRLHGWAYKPGNAKHTPLVGKLINKYVYAQLPPGVLEELQRLNPLNEKGRRRYKNHQFLTEETGNVHLDRQITSTTTLMRISATQEEFDANFEKAFPLSVPQPRLPLVVDVK